MFGEGSCGGAVMTGTATLTRTDAPTAELITLDEVKEQSRVTHSDQDAMLVGYRNQAVEWLDGWTGQLGRALAPQEWQLALGAFPCDGIRLPLGPLIAVSAVAYRDEAGALFTIDPAAYRVTPEDGRAVIDPVTAWPVPGRFRDAVRVTWTCGQPVADIPGPIKLAAKLLAAHWYDHGAAADVPPMIRSLIAPYRRVWL
jgi:uncharacterized phiE125 gp8 family phage protein